VPTIHVHLLDVDRRESEPDYESSDNAMHYCNVCFPLATCLSSAACDANELIEALAKVVEERFKQTPRAQGLLAQGATLSLRTGHHKKSEHEIGAARFVVSACASAHGDFTVGASLGSAPSQDQGAFSLVLRTRPG
jgi:hypothetical protein